MEVTGIAWWYSKRRSAHSRLDSVISSLGSAAPVDSKKKKKENKPQINNNKTKYTFVGRNCEEEETWKRQAEVVCVEGALVVKLLRGGVLSYISQNFIISPYTLALYHVNRWACDVEMCPCLSYLAGGSLYIPLSSAPPCSALYTIIHYHRCRLKIYMTPMALGS